MSEHLAPVLQMSDYRRRRVIFTDGRRPTLSPKNRSTPCQPVPPNTDPPPCA